jgi:ribosomal protein L37AE/L43A
MVQRNRTGEFKAIETTYNGRLYRSRLEAKWAVMLDALNVRFEYEAEGYETPYGRYLPDFWLPDAYCRAKSCKGVLLEVKPEGWDEDLTVKWVERTATEDGLIEDDVWQTNTEARLQYVAIQLGAAGLIVRGLDSAASEWMEVAPEWDAPMMLYACPTCGAVKFEYQESNYMRCPKCGAADASASYVRIAQALHAARTYRFW